MTTRSAPPNPLAFLEDAPAQVRDGASDKELAPTFERLGDEFIFEWPQHGVILSFAHLHEGHEGPHGEILVTSIAVGELHWSRLNLASAPAREGLVKKLEKALPTAPWRPILDRACRRATMELRIGDPIVCLMPRRAPATRHLIAKLVLAEETNVLFGDGGAGKSQLALAAAVAGSTGRALPGGIALTGEPVRVLYLDYESCLEEHQDRLAGLLAGLGISDAPPILYRPMVRPLADDAAHLRAEIARHQIGLLIVDSLAPACGPEPEGADAVVRTFTALRSFGAISRLVTAHVSKVTADQRTGAARPFGSVFVQNLARNVWEVRKAEEDAGQLVIGLYHRKFNSGRLLPPFSLRIEHDGESISLQDHDVRETPDLLARTPLTYQLRNALKAGARTLPELVEETQGSKGSIGRTLRRWRLQGKVIQVDADRWGLKA